MFLNPSPGPYSSGYRNTSLALSSPERISLAGWGRPAAGWLEGCASTVNSKSSVTSPGATPPFSTIFWAIRFMSSRSTWRSHLGTAKDQDRLAASVCSPYAAAKPSRQVG
jgi:hypothetical protein